jgi:heat shock protein HtpX
VSSLRKIDSAARQIPMDANPATSHMYIISPFLGGAAKLFSTHPPTEERVRRLMERT